MPLYPAFPTATTAVSGGVILDGTAADIAADSTSGGVAGASTKAASATHAHPFYDFVPGDHGLITWAFDPALATSTSTPLATGSTVYVTKLHVPVAQNVTNIEFWLITAGSVLTSGQNFVALYQAGTLVGVSADQTSAWGSNGNKKAALAGGPFAVAAGDVYVAYWFNGTTGPAPLRGISNGSANYNIAAASSRFGTANTSVTTTAPGSLATVAAANTAYWAGLS